MKKGMEIAGILAAVVLVAGVAVSGRVAEAAWDLPVVPTAHTAAVHACTLSTAGAGIMAAASVERLSLTDTDALTVVSADRPATAGAALSPAVYTDWSRLTPYAPARSRYTYFEPFAGSEPLAARDDYGPLLPYIGAEVATDHDVLSALPLWGLVTLDGRMVTDPVYASISVQGPFLLLSRGNLTGYEDSGRGRTPAGGFLYTVAAPDGSWVRDAGSCSELFLLDRNHLLVTGDNGSIRVLSSGGDWTAEYSRTELEAYLGGGYAWNWETGPMPWFQGDGIVGIWEADDASAEGSRYACYLDTESGEVCEAIPAGRNTASAVMLEDAPEFPGYGYVEKLTDIVTGKTWYFGWRRGAVSQAEDLLSEDGTVVREGCFLPGSLQWQPIIADGMVGMVRDGVFSYTSLTTGRTVFSYPLRTNSD